MTLTALLAILALALLEILASYISRVYAEFGKILSREVQDNLDAWEELIEPHIGLTREHAALSAAVAQQLALCGIAIVFTDLLFDRAFNVARATPGEFVQAALGVILVVVFCNQFIPWLLFERTEGRWPRRLMWPIRLLLWAVTPITVVIRFFFSLAALAEPPAADEEEGSVDVEALLEAGEEEGILEETDRELVRSAVEFGDVLVKEVMTPRPQVFAVKDTTTLEQFLVELKEHNFSRVPVYAGTLDNITGIAFAHDLLQIADLDARTRTVASIQRPAAFVPETKKGYELLREMQREKQHMRIVIDEYGGVAGLVTIEDLLEQIVGEIRDEHDVEAPKENPQREETGAWVVPGSFPVNELHGLFGNGFQVPEEYEAATVGGLVSEIEGRIPLAGEVVELTSSGLRMEVVASTDRRIDRVRVFPPVHEEDTASPRPAETHE
ncbi:hemolysin family protein [Occallatibacter riparius]|uniref:Hemolysin family protein n=1 Tax=Occallatibacter riparius TaxID=1002689 RepID=A0A9J7BXA9_9BACT|nr:hemolysin family protein [Occallatibacter riparius]UWZ86514.1 hemolysin family protein [Occallatibacter riparius]